MTTNLKCFLCLNSCGPDAEECENSEDKFYLFINYVAANRKAISSLSFCKKCKTLLESFSRLHATLELARMKVDSCVQKICDVMLDGNQREKNVENENIRKDILDKSFLKIKKSQPVVKVTKLRFVSGDGDTPSTVVVTHPPAPTASSSSRKKIKIEAGHKLPEFIWEKGTVVKNKKEGPVYYCSICDKDFTSKEFSFHQSHSAFYERLCVSNSQNPTELLQTLISEPEITDLFSETGIVVKTELAKETSQEEDADPLLLEETLPHFIIRKSCIQRDDHVETLYHCNLCNKSFLGLPLHLKKHEILSNPNPFT